MKTTRYFFIIPRSINLRIRNVSDKVVEKIKTHILCSISFFSENLAVYETTWKNSIEQCRLQMIILRLRIACWVTKATKTHSLYVILIAFPLQKQSHERASVLNHTCLACLVNPIHNSTLCSS